MLKYWEGKGHSMPKCSIPVQRSGSKSREHPSALSCLSVSGFQQIWLEWEQNTQWVSWQLTFKVHVTKQAAKYIKGGGGGVSTLFFPYSRTRTAGLGQTDASAIPVSSLQQQLKRDYLGENLSTGQAYSGVCPAYFPARNRVQHWDFLKWYVRI